MKIVRKIPLVILLIWPYLMSVAGLFSDEILTSYFISILVVCLVSVVNAIFYKSDHTETELAFWAMLIKLVHVPFYMWMFIGGVLMLPASLLTILVAFAWFIYLMMFVIDYVFLLSSSAYLIKSMWSAKKQGIIHVAVAIIFTICSFVFVADTICAIVNYIIIRNYKK